jgi:hypothetical protein
MANETRSGGGPAAIPPVAVVAIHGVGHHESGASASAVADLLLGVADAAGPLYEPFTTRRLQIPQPNETPEKPQKQSLWERAKSVFQERRGDFEKYYQLSSWFGRSKCQPPSTDSIARSFMDSLVKQYRGDPARNSTQTFRLESVRASRDPRPAKKVDLYDMCWADLARPSNSFLRFFFSFYQLVIHLPSLGRIALDHAAMEHMGAPEWFLLQRIYTYTNRILTAFIVNLLALLPLAAFSPVVLLLKNDVLAKSVAAAVQLALVFALILFLIQFSTPGSKKSTWWNFLLPGALISVAFSLGLFAAYDVTAAPVLLTVEWWLLGAGVVLAVFAKYDEVRAGGREVGLLLTGATSIGFAICALTVPAESISLRLKTAAFWMIQYIFVGLRLLWLLFFALALAGLVMEGICRLRFRGDPGKRARASAAMRTGRFTLAVSSSLLVLLTVFLWSGAYHFVAKRIDLFGTVPAKLAPGLDSGVARAFVLTADETRSLPMRPDSDACQQPAGCPLTAYRFLEGLLFQSAPPGFPLVLGFIAGGFLILVLMVLPSVYREIQAPRRAQNGVSRRLGSWLSGGLASLPVIIWCFWLAAFGAPVLYTLTAYVSYLRSSPPERFLAYLYDFWGMRFSGQLLTSAGALIAGSAVVIFGLVLKYGSAALDAILDVDSYLRTSPAGATPRARIVERYRSLLDFLWAYRGPDGKPYERIVIVAHSLGSNITADLLYYLHGRHHASAPGEGGFPVEMHLFTMGSPLRQLLNRFFPHLYFYIRPVPDGSGVKEVAVPGTVAPSSVPPGRGTIPENGPPDPSGLGLAKWVNFFRSGDYVGRTLWLDDQWSRNNDANSSGAYPEPLIVFTDTRRSRMEACIGLGAHTHYWDRSAPDVGEMLDAVI